MIIHLVFAMALFGGVVTAIAPVDSLALALEEIASKSVENPNIIKPKNVPLPQPTAQKIVVLLGQTGKSSPGDAHKLAQKAWDLLPNLVEENNKLYYDTGIYEKFQKLIDSGLFWGGKLTPEILEEMLIKDADLVNNINKFDQDARGWRTLLFSAIEYKKPELIPILLKHGANPELGLFHVEPEHTTKKPTPFRVVLKSSIDWAIEKNVDQKYIDLMRKYAGK